MAVNTPQQELVVLWQTLIRTNYPDVAALDNSINLTTFVVTPNNDLMAQFLSQTLANIHDSQLYGFTEPLTPARKRALYLEYVDVMNQAITNLQALSTAINTYATALPTS